jgi:prevent-host-death family protein
MPKTVNIHEAKTQLSRLLSRVERGEEIVIARAGRPVARLLPFETRGATRLLGGDEDVVWIAADFDAPLPEDVLAEFEQ